MNPRKTVPSIMSTTPSATATMKLMSTNIQNSLRRARPLKTAYFLRTARYQSTGSSPSCLVVQGLLRQCRPAPGRPSTSRLARTLLEVRPNVQELVLDLRRQLLGARGRAAAAVGLQALAQLREDGRPEIGTGRLERVRGPRHRCGVAPRHAVAHGREARRGVLEVGADEAAQQLGPAAGLHQQALDYPGIDVRLALLVGRNRQPAPQHTLQLVDREGLRQVVVHARGQALVAVSIDRARGE